MLTLVRQGPRRQAAGSGAQDLDEICIHFQFRRDGKLNNAQQPRGDGCLESLRLVRTSDLLYDLFRYDERIRRQFPEQIQSAFSHDPRRERLENTMDTIGIKPGNSGFIRCNGYKAYNYRL